MYSISAVIAFIIAAVVGLVLVLVYPVSGIHLGHQVFKFSLLVSHFALQIVDRILRGLLVAPASSLIPYPNGGFFLGHGHGYIRIVIRDIFSSLGYQRWWTLFGGITGNHKDRFMLSLKNGDSNVSRSGFLRPE